MKITEIQASCGVTFSHPHESFSNFRPSITLKATISEGEDPMLEALSLELKALVLVEGQKRHILSSIQKEEEERNQKEQEERKQRDKEYEATHPPSCEGVDCGHFKFRHGLDGKGSCQAFGCTCTVFTFLPF